MNKGERKRSDQTTQGGSRKKAPHSRPAASPSDNNTQVQRTRSNGNPRIAVSTRIVPEKKDRIDREVKRLKMINVSDFIGKAIDSYLEKIRER